MDGWSKLSDVMSGREEHDIGVGEASLAMMLSMLLFLRLKLVLKLFCVGQNQNMYVRTVSKYLIAQADHHGNTIY